MALTTVMRQGELLALQRRNRGLEAWSAGVVPRATPARSTMRAFTTANFDEGPRLRAARKGVRATEAKLPATLARLQLKDLAPGAHRLNAATKPAPLG